MCKISVVIPIYNVEIFIEKCVRSLFEQSFEDVEYIFIDDCSPDHSVDIIERVLKEYPLRKKQVRILHNKQNLGRSVTRKKGIMSATGDYIIHCDPDDWVELDWLSCLYNKAIEKNADLVWCDFTRFFNDGTKKYCSSTAESIKEDALLKLITGPRHGALWANLVKREIAQNPCIIWPSWEYCEDLTLVFQYTALAQKVLYINKSLYCYRDNPEGICNAKDKAHISDKINAAINAILVELECSKSVGLYKKFKPYCLSEIFNVKTNVFLIADSDMRACRMWRNTPDHLSFFDIWRSNMCVRKKINTSLICLYIYPFYKKLKCTIVKF